MTILKRFLKALTCAFLLLTLPAKIVCASDEISLPISAWDISAAEDSSVSASLYELSCGGYRVEISGQGKMKNFSDSAPPPWHQYAGQIISAHIGAGVENLGRFTFNSCTVLEKIIIEGMTVILPADIFPIPQETKIYAHANSNIADYVLANNPDSFSFLCEFNNSVCSVCSYRCTYHTGGKSTCTAGALCEICGVEYEMPKGHSLGTIIAEIPADCKNEGMMAHYVCSECGLWFDAEENLTSEKLLIIPIKHTLGELIPYSPPKCTSHGTVAHYHCGACGANFDENNQQLYNIYLPATDHSGGVATCTSCAVCDVCKKPYGEIDANNHTYSKDFSHDGVSHWYECACGEVKEKKEHSFTSRVTKPQTIEEEGIKEFSCNCGYKYEEILPKLSSTPQSPSDEVRGDSAVWIFVIVGTVIFVSAAVVVAVLIFRKKK